MITFESECVRLCACASMHQIRTRRSAAKKRNNNIHNSMIDRIRMNGKFQCVWLLNHTRFTCSHYILHTDCYCTFFFLLLWKNFHSQQIESAGDGDWSNNESGYLCYFIY